MNDIKVIAFYLPQFHPIPENDLWWGKGFTEWTNVAKAKPLFKGHQQPRIPADLGFYDLRLVEVFEAQVKMAEDAKISAFCFWHYWFGNGKQLLEKPIEMYLANKQLNFPFCLAWANHSWQKKSWNPEISRLSKELLIEQEYPLNEDIDKHFYKMLPMFKDSRYYKISGKLAFVIYMVEDLPDPKYFVSRWNELALLNDLPEFYFIGHTSNESNITSKAYGYLDAINLHNLHSVFRGYTLKRYFSWLSKRPLNAVEYSKAISLLKNDLFRQNKIYPTIYPNWDASPRLGSVATMLLNSTPELFKRHAKQIFSNLIDKSDSDKIVFLKSWNEWAEGNYMEPDLLHGNGYIKALSEAIDESTSTFSE